jgi:omega-6 fatty acid desaturase (delta-12 desaturase)
MRDEALTLDQDSAETSEGLRIGRELINATVPFVEDSARLSWWHVGSTFAMLAAARPGGHYSCCFPCSPPC